MTAKQKPASTSNVIFRILSLFQISIGLILPLIPAISKSKYLFTKTTKCIPVIELYDPRYSQFIMKCHAVGRLPIPG